MTFSVYRFKSPISASGVDLGWGRGRANWLPNHPSFGEVQQAITDWVSLPSWWKKVVSKRIFEHKNINSILLYVIFQQVICLSCNSCRDLDLCRDPFITPAEGNNPYVIVMYMGYWLSVKSRWLDIGQVLFWRVYSFGNKQEKNC